MSRPHSASPSFPQGEIRSLEGLPVINPHAAGADIGAQQIFVCIPGPDQTQIVRSFGTYTADLQALADWLVENGIQTIAMESTGVYWMPLFEVLEQCGIHCCLISGNLAAASLLVTRPTCWTASGFKDCMRSVCWSNPSVPKPS